MTVDDMYFSIGMGSMDYDGTITGDMTGDCGMGTVYMSLSGKKATITISWKHQWAVCPSVKMILPGWRRNVR